MFSFITEHSFEVNADIEKLNNQYEFDCSEDGRILDISANGSKIIFWVEDYNDSRLKQEQRKIRLVFNEEYFKKDCCNDNYIGTIMFTNKTVHFYENYNRCDENCGYKLGTIGDGKLLNETLGFEL